MGNHHDVLHSMSLGHHHSRNGGGNGTIVQYAPQDGGHFFVPTAISSTSATSVMGQHEPHHGIHIQEESNRKREMRLMKNREAARECRRKKKEYVKCLENRVAVLENQNKTLIEELKSLKELYCQKEAQS